MEKWAEIRRLIKVEKRSKRSVRRQFGIHWDTLVKILEHTEPPGYRQAQPRAKRKIGPFLEVISEILEGDKTVHRRQHRTARRIFDRLKDEYRYPGGYTAVKEVVRDRRLRQREVFMSLSHRPAEAQVDFGVADVIWESQLGSVSANFIARWNGSPWSSLGDGVNDRVLALASYDDGSGEALYVGGAFTVAGGVPVLHVAKWTGTNWVPVGIGLHDRVWSLAVFDDGAGAAIFAGERGITKWDGQTWSQVADIGNIHALTVFDDGGGPGLYAGGFAIFLGGAAYIAKWDGSKWSSLGTGMNDEIRAMAVIPQGPNSGLYAGGTFTIAGGAPASRVAKWTPILYGDVDRSGIIDVFDLFCIRDGFAGDFGTCSLADTDIEPCSGDADIDLFDLFDLFAVLNAFSGVDPCCGGLP